MDRLERMKRQLGAGIVLWVSRVFVALMAIPPLYAFLLLAGLETNSAVRWAFGLVATTLVIGGAFFLIIGYLNSPSRRIAYGTILSVPQLEERLNKIETAIASAQACAGNNQEFHLDDLREQVLRIVAELQPSEVVANVSDIQDKPRNKDWGDVLTDFTVTKNRLLDEMSDLSRRTNLNLAFGTTTTIVAGIGLILIVVFSPHLDAANVNAYPWILLSHYVPRLSLIIFAEVFAYFFLRLYKAGLPDAKYYQNEITNIEMRLVALKAALVLDNADSVTVVVENLARTDRNVTLRSGIATIKPENAKDDSIDAERILRSIEALLKVKVA